MIPVITMVVALAVVSAFAVGYMLGTIHGREEAEG